MGLLDGGIARQLLALKRAGMTKPATLTKVTQGTRTPGAVSAGANPTTTTHTAHGFVEDWRALYLGATTVQVGDRVVLLLAATIAGGVEPRPGDRVTIEGVTSRVIDVARDPATATYALLTRA